MSQFNIPCFQKRTYFFSLIILLTLCCSFLLALGKADSFIGLNAYHTNWLNVFFEYYTYVGDGLFSLILSIVLFFFFKYKKMAIAIFLSFITSGIAIQIIKNFVYEARPKLFFEHTLLPFFIKDVTLYNMSSFPSGHTTSAFATATAIVLFQKSNNWQLLILFFAAMVAYSRIYLSQHFLGDVIVGAVIGTVFGVLCSWIILKSNHPFFLNKNYATK